MEKKNKNLNAKEFKKLFERYNIYTLDSINILLNVVGEVEQNLLVIRTFNSAYHLAPPNNDTIWLPIGE